jgi:DNA-directed RNA polymerase specialized sigma24 family protein
MDDGRQIVYPIDMNEAELNDLFASCLPKLKKAARRMLCNQQDSEDARAFNRCEAS